MNYLDTVKHMVQDKEKRVQNVVLLIILLVVILIASKYIFATKPTTSSNNSHSTNVSENINNSEKTKTISTDLETKLSTILSQIAGISDVSVVLTYSQDTTQKPIYNTKEEESNDKKTTEKSVAYNEEGGSKTAIIETIEMPKIEGAIVVAKGASTVDIRSKIASAISTVTGVAVYKVQVFEKNG